MAPQAKVKARSEQLVQRSIRTAHIAVQETESKHSSLRLFPIECIASLRHDEIVLAQKILRHGETFGVWSTPPEWLSHTKSSTLFDINLRSRIEHFLNKEETDSTQTYYDEHLIEIAVLTLSRYLILCRVAPAALGSGRHHLKATSVAVIAYQFGPQLFAAEITKRRSGATWNEQSSMSPDPVSSSSAFFSSLTLDDFAHYSNAARDGLLKEGQRMRKLHSMGVWEYGPKVNEESRSSLIARGRRNNKERTERNPYLPFPDDFVSQASERCLWLIHDVYPSFIELGEELISLWKSTLVTPLTNNAVKLRRARGIRKILLGYEWRDKRGNLIEEPPFPIRQRVSQGFRSLNNEAENASLLWPPRNYSQVIGLFNAIQAAHLFIFFLSTGGRKSEVLSLKRDCIEYEVNGRAYAHGRIFKVVIQHDGERFEWQLPDIALTALEQQSYLGYLYEHLHTLDIDAEPRPESSNNLWSRISAFRKLEGDATLTEINRRLQNFVKYFALDPEPSGHSVHSHRFRKTLARLVALAVKEAPKLLMEIFGHKSIEMTLGYILTDKDLQGDIEIVAREISVMRAKAIIEDMVAAACDTQRSGESLGGYGGGGAQTLSEAISSHRAEFHARGTDWSISGPLELAELLTLQGKCWEQVREGVMCIKLPSEVGPCNKHVGRPEPSRCATKCNHRLEECFLKDDVDGAIRDCVAAYEQTLSSPESLTGTYWAGQIKANIPRFKDLENKWSSHPIVQLALTHDEDISND